MTVHVVDRGGVRVITIDRPERRNALDPTTMHALGDAFRTAEHDDAVRVVVLTGAGDRAFCSGMDLKAFAERGTAPDLRTAVGTEVFVERVYPKPIVAAVNGAAVGGGFGIALACDIIIAAEHATFALPEVQRGLVGAGAGSRLAMRTTPAVALELILTGEAIDAERACGLGIVNRVVPAAELLDAATSVAHRIAENAPIAVRISKEIVYDVTRVLGGIDMAAIRAKAATAMTSEDAREGARAFAEKRRPRFTGR